MSVFLLEFEFSLHFEQESFIVPFEVKDPGARIESAYAKTTIDGNGKKEVIGALLVRDRIPEQVHPAPELLAQYAIVVRRLGALVDLPESAGSLVGSFSSHQGRHHWHVFAPKREREAPRQPGGRAASPLPRGASDESGLAGPGMAPPPMRASESSPGPDGAPSHRAPGVAKPGG
jgi:hypothetical protein